MNQFVGRISFKHLAVPGAIVEDEARELVLQFVAETDVKSSVFIYEFGDVNGEPHCHFYFETFKSSSTIVRKLKIKFRLPPSVGFVYAMKANSIHICFAFIRVILSFLCFFCCVYYMQAYSLKKADPLKLADYFVYLAKGINSKRGDRVAVLFESEPRLWDMLHSQFHDVASSRRVANARQGPSDFYQELADRCLAQRKTSKQDVLGEVVRYYVEDGKKGFSRFQVEATFGRVFSIVNGCDAKCLYYSIAEASLFRW